MNYINIRIAGENLDFGEINRELNFDRAVWHKKGDIGEYKGEKFNFKEDIWQARIEVLNRGLIDELEANAIKLYEHKEYLQFLSRKCDFSLWITVYPEEVQSNMRFSNNLLKMISEIGANIDYSIMNLKEFYC